MPLRAKQTHPEFSRLLREVAAGRMDKDQAWKQWCEYKARQDQPETDNPCALCDGFGGLAIVGSAYGSHVCPVCGGSGKA